MTHLTTQLTTVEHVDMAQTTPMPTEQLRAGTRTADDEAQWGETIKG